MARVHFVLKDEKKSRWDNHVEENPALDDRSDLIRTAVEEYIADDGDSSSEGLNDTVAIDDDLENIEARLGDIEDKLQLLRLENVQEEEIAEIASITAEDYFNDFLRELDDGSSTRGKDGEQRRRK